tara:strand:+ start:107 stop:592 length:486 start_codon:yes stop_codon:yes gene_type:complete
MVVTFDKISDESRIWIFQSNQLISDLDIESLEKKIEVFLSSWTSHGDQLMVASKIKYNLFIIIALDQSCSTASGCSIDKLVNFIKNIENEYQISLLDRLDISYRDKNKISVLRLDDFKRKILEKKINNDTIVFNNLINLKSDLNYNWEIPINRSWHQKLIK